MKNFYFLLFILPSLLFANEVKPKQSKLSNVTVFLEGASIERSATFNVIPGENIILFNNLSPDIDESSIQFSGLKNTSILSLSYDINFLEKKVLSKKYLNFRAKIDSLHRVISMIDNEIAGYNEELTILSKNQVLNSNSTDLALDKVKTLATYYRSRVTEIRNKTQELQFQKVNVSEIIKDYANEMLKLKDNTQEERGEITLKLDAPSASNLVLNFSYTIKKAGWFPLYDVRATDIESPVNFSYKANVYQQSGTDWNDVNIVLSTGDPTTNNVKPTLNSKWLKFVSHNYNPNKAVENSSIKYNPTVGTVSGYVYDDSGLPLPGVNVILKGTGTGTQTDFDGRYSINVSGARDLIFSYVGFDSQSIPVSSSTLNITLEEGASLSEVMITSSSAYSESNESRMKPKASFVQTLSGMVPGLNISNANGQPGANSNVRIRGISSINGDKEPLFIVNGAPVDQRNFRSLNPDNIASVSVLKNAGATAIYGNRGANGVILITLKDLNASGNYKEEGLTNTRFEIKNKYTIKSNQEITVIEVDTFELPATFKHYAAPELNENVFLTASIAGWEKYDLLYGEANIYFSGTYAGKTLINPLATEENLELSMGVDPNVIITRKKLDNFKSKSFLGTNRIVEKEYEIKVKNTKQSVISLLIEDRIPVSQNKEIKVDDITYDDAEYDDENGILKWELTLGANEQMARRLSYIVKYPKYKTVNL